MGSNTSDRHEVPRLIALETSRNHIDVRWGNLFQDSSGELR